VKQNISDIFLKEAYSKLYFHHSYKFATVANLFCNMKTYYMVTMITITIILEWVINKMRR